MGGFNHPYLDLARMEMLRRVRLKPKGLAEGTFAGPHKSHYRGSAVEFADYRDYVKGDDIRLVDWKVFARSDKYYIRLYEAERNLLSYLVVDTSGSMGFDGVLERTDSKLVQACRLAAAMAYLVVDEGDELGCSLAAAELDEHLPARSSWIHLAAVADALGRAEATGATRLGHCLKEVYRRCRQRGVLIVLSDFLDPDPELWKAVDCFRQTHFDVMAFHLVHPEELELPDVPLARFVESEGGAGSFNVEPDILREAYRRRFAAHLARTEAGFKTRGGDWFLARTDHDPYLLLKEAFLRREAVA